MPSHHEPDGYDVASLAPGGGVFGPADLARMTAAFHAALTIAGDDGGPFGLLGGRALRAALARAIVGEVRRGVHDVDLLKAGALRTLSLREVRAG